MDRSLTQCFSVLQSARSDKQRLLESDPAWRRGVVDPVILENGVDETGRHGNKRLRVAFLLLMPVLPYLETCVSERPERRGSSNTIHDSAGVTIVESTDPAWQPNEQWSIAETSSVSIGAVDGAYHYQLAGVRGVIELSDGRIVIANAGTMEVRCYTRDGKFLWTSGRRGQGPGDYWTLAHLARYPGDSVLVHDFGLRRYSLVDPAGRFVRSWNLKLPENDEAASSSNFVGTLGNGTILVSSSPSRRGRTAPAVTRHATTLFAFRTSGEPVALLGTFPGDEYYEGTGFAIRRLPFARGTRFAVTDSAVFAATDDSYEIRQIRPDGAVAMILRRTATKLELTSEQIAAQRERLKASRRAERAKLFRGMPDSIYRRLAADEESMLSAIPFPPALPAYGDVMVDREGYLWVEEFPRDEADLNGRSWSIFEPRGRWLGDVRLPARFTLSIVTADHVLGVQTDDLGVEYVRVFPIIGRRTATR